MRTTIEIPDEQRAKLLELAGRRGERGFSRLVQEAIEKYLAEVAGEDERIASALATLGTLSNAAAAELEASVRKLRGHRSARRIT